MEGVATIFFALLPLPALYGNIVALRVCDFGRLKQRVTSRAGERSTSVMAPLLPR